ncbi:MAG: lipid-A-disaccharide synthase, partial [Lentisphaerae bacterium]|nr:lipid-A-disaccharide synthase [Lentisphaerota bacterium]
MSRKSIMIIAGELSGDMHAAAVARAIRRRAPQVELFGIGGDELRQAGMEIIVDAREMAVLGLTEV